MVSSISQGHEGFECNKEAFPVKVQSTFVYTEKIVTKQTSKSVKKILYSAD